MKRNSLVVTHDGSPVLSESARYIRECGYDVTEIDSEQACQELIVHQRPPLVLCNLKSSHAKACQCLKRLTIGNANGRPFVAHISENPSGLWDTMGLNVDEILPYPKYPADLLPWIKMFFRYKNMGDLYRAIYENAPIGILLHDLEGRIRDANPAVCEMIGLSRQRLISRGVDTFLNREALEANEQFRNEWVAGQVTHCRFQSSHRRLSDGAYRDTEMQCAAYRYQGEHRFMALVDDKTERKQAEDQLQQSHKMEAIGTLAGGMAHEFNNILGIIIGNTELATDEISSANLAQEFLTEIRIASRRAKDVVRKILSFAGKTTYDPKPVRIGALIEETARFLRPTIPTTIEIHTHIQCSSETVFADASEMNQVLMHLITNAAQAMPEKRGAIDLSLEPIQLNLANASEYNELNPGKYVQLVVSDDGTGIAAKDIDRIFTPYFTTKELNQGVGMGLAIVYGIIKKHGGDITVNSREGEGTEMTVLLPIVKAPVELQNEALAMLPTGTESILLVDDDPPFVKVVEATLKRLGYDVHATMSSDMALSMVAESPDFFDLVIAGMAMPIMAGDELARRLLMIRRKLPIILCTGHSESIDEAGAKAQGISAFFLKPIETQTLAVTARKLLDQRG